MTKSPRSWQVRLASGLVGLGAVVGVGLIVLAFALMRGDPGFLFAVLPFVFLVLTVAGVNIAAFSLALVVRLRRGDPGVRVQVALLGGSLAVCGVCVAQGSAAAAAFLVLYGATLLWLMTGPAAARDLGPWLAPPRRRAWFTRATAPSDSPAAVPRPWWETWRIGLAQGLPLWEMLVVGAAMVVFAIGLMALPLGLARFPALATASIPLIVLAMAAVWFVERRMKARLARR
jgi:hypothetical protein